MDRQMRPKTIVAVQPLKTEVINKALHTDIQGSVPSIFGRMLLDLDSVTVSSIGCSVTYTRSQCPVFACSMTYTRSWCPLFWCTMTYTRSQCPLFGCSITYTRSDKRSEANAQAFIAKICHKSAFWRGDFW